MTKVAIGGGIVLLISIAANLAKLLPEPYNYISYVVIIASIIAIVFDLK